MKFSKVVLRLMVLWTLIYIYIILHEGGHSLVVYLSGGEITYFNINLFDARMGYRGELSNLQESIFHIGGFLLPYLTWLMFILLVPKDKESKLLEYIKVYSSPILGTVLPWIIIPLLYTFGKAPKGDDVTKFLQTSSLSSLLVSIGFICVFILSIILWKSKIHSAKEIFLRQDKEIRLKKSTVVVLGAVSLAGLLLMSFPLINKGDIQVPEAYELICEADLSDIEGDGWELCKFWLEESKSVKVFISSNDLKSDLFNLTLEGTRGTNKTFINSDGYNGPLTINTKMDLVEGEYKFMLNTLNSTGRLYIYIDKR